MKIISNKIFVLIILYIILFVSCDYEINLDGQGCRDSPREPPYKEACLSFHSKDIACCYATIEFKNRTIVNKCVPVPRDARFALNYLTVFSFTDYDNLEYKDVTANFECGQKDRLCGTDHPEQIFQCNEHSSSTQSCCYLSTPTYTECVLSDKKFNQETPFNLFDTSTVICNSNKINIKYQYLLIYFIMIIIWIIFL